MLLSDGQINDIATGITYAGMCDATTLGRAIARAQHEKDKAEFKKWGEELCEEHIPFPHHSHTARLPRRLCSKCWAELEG